MWVSAADGRDVLSGGGGVIVKGDQRLEGFDVLLLIILLLI